jgi:hypothetical protein
LDYILSLCLGLILPVIMLRGRRSEMVAITPLMAFMLIPPMVTVGHGIALGDFKDLVLPGILGIFANGTALTVGSLITHYVLGLTRHPASDFVRRWKQKEVEEGAFHKIFERLRLTRFLEYSGTLWARAAVIGTLAVVFFVPLQLAITRLGREYSINQTISTMAHETFDQTDRSGIWSIHTDDENDAVRTRIRIHTQQFYTPEEQKEFIRQVSKSINKPFVLRLDQIPGSLDQGNAPAPSLNGALPKGQLADRMRDLQLELGNVEGTIPGLKDIGMKVLGFGLEFPAGDASGIVLIRCLKSGELSGDTRQLLRGQFAGKLQLNPDQVRLEVWNGHFESDSLQLESFHAEQGGNTPLELLERHPDLHARVLLPAFLPADSVPVWEARLEKKYHFEADPNRISMRLDSGASRFVVEVW